MGSLITLIGFLLLYRSYKYCIIKNCSVGFNISDALNNSMNIMLELNITFYAFSCVYIDLKNNKMNQL